MNLSEGTVVINAALHGTEHQPRRRFTLAHEVSHWILHRSYHSPTNQQYRFRAVKNNYVACRESTIESFLDERNTETDWEEWQANALAAAILMPLASFHHKTSQVIREHTGSSYLLDTHSSRDFYRILSQISDTFAVSKSAAKIRMKQLGFIKDISVVFD
jgi:Zn-dependent peptidase ImmA (M78 family)